MRRWSIFVVVFAACLYPSIICAAVINEKYCQIDTNHTLCLHFGKISTNCGEVTSRGLDDSEKSLATQLHNQLRAKLARGEEIRGHPGPQPSASNMMQMVWDNELELEAQTWTDQCVVDHDCNDCRKLDRFKVGQNLYWFGHLSGSWEQAVHGWYDEVADFNSSFVFPFYVVPGVLVGHFTQLAWAQTWRIGCGKITYISKNHLQNNEVTGQQLYICNYGVAGNFIRSEMYQKGDPCSQCPAGTSCSSEYPGLCSGTPDQPLTIRPPIILPEDFAGFPTSQSGSNSNGGSNGNIPIPGGFLTVNPPPVIAKNASCIHRCKKNGGCSVRIKSNVMISGAVLGSCFPPLFGGECSGIPKDCKPCIDVCTGYSDQELVVHLDEDGNQKGMIDIRPFEEGPKVNPEQEINGDGNENTAASCIYNCKNDGGCSVKIQSDKPISGNTLGSCFPPLFGGSCSGIPEKCDNCSTKCEGRLGEKFSENV